MSVSLKKSLMVKALIATLVATTLFAGCVSAPSNHQKNKVQKVNEDNVYAITIKEGITTKSDIWAVLGQPHGYLQNNMSYDTRDYKVLINLEYIEKSGHKYYYQIHRTKPNSGLNIQLDDKDVVHSIHVY